MCSKLFFCRDIIPALIQALKPGGLVYYRTFIQQGVSDRGPQQMEFRLADQELLHLFSGLQVLFYREEGCVGNVQKGFRDEAMPVGRKRGASGHTAHTSGTNGF
jgi:tellurite methyltransferase